MTTTYADIHIKVNKDVKAESEKILGSIGITMSDLINMTLRRVIYERQIPFSTKIEPDAAPESMTVNSREELNALLRHLIDDDNGNRLTEAEIWGNLRQ